MIFIYVRRFKYLITIGLTLVIVIYFINYPTSFLKRSYPLRFQGLVNKYANMYDHDPYLVYAIIKAESGFRAGVQSHRGAKGLMQVTDRTGKWGAESIKLEHFTVEDLYDPEINIHIGCWYLSVLKKEFDDNLRLVITAYNGGSGRVREWLDDSELSRDGINLEEIPYSETEKYVNKVMNDYAIYKKLYSH